MRQADGDEIRKTQERAAPGRPYDDAEQFEMRAADRGRPPTTDKGRMPPAGTANTHVPRREKPRKAPHPCPFGTAEDALDQHMARLGLPQVDDRFTTVRERVSTAAAQEAMRWGRALAQRNRQQVFRAPYRTMGPATAALDEHRPTPRGALPYDLSTLRESWDATRDIYEENVLIAKAMRNPITHTIRDAEGNEIESLPYEKAPTPRERPSTADVEREDVERARRYRLAYERDHVDRPPAVDGNLTPFPINRYFPMPPAAEYAPDHKY